MKSRLAWPTIYLVQRCSMVLTLACCGYIIFFLLFRWQSNFAAENNDLVSPKDGSLLSPSPVFGLKPYDMSIAPHARDIFSLTTAVGSSGAEENVPQGQLPGHLKIVGVLISHPSQIIIEDSLANKTYFIDEATPQAGIKIRMVRVNGEGMVINYQGQDIYVPINKT